VTLPVQRAPSGLLLARGLSVIGHPALLMPLAVALSTRARGAPADVVNAATVAAVGVALLVGLYSLWRARSGAWQHVDASVPHERLELNRRLVLLLAGGAALGAALGASAVVVGGLLACAALVGGALLLRRWLKVSLHTGFAAFAACLLWPITAWCALTTALAVGVAWSRWRLQRHTQAEIVVGALLGMGVGTGFQLGLALQAAGV
jgi:hypothetical protein